MAFQAIVDVPEGRIFAQEALVRGLQGQNAGYILEQVTPGNRYAFDQQCRIKAIELGSSLLSQTGDQFLSINFMPNAVYDPKSCIRRTLNAAQRTGFPLTRILFEFTEDESVDSVKLLNILHFYREVGFKTAIDDFGAGYSGLNLLASSQPDFVKFDMHLIRGIDSNRVKQTILRHSLLMLEELGVTAICEGVETEGELQCLIDMGVRYIQGFLLAMPCFECVVSDAAIPSFSWLAQKNAGAGETPAPAAPPLVS